MSGRSRFFEAQFEEFELEEMAVVALVTFGDAQSLRNEATVLALTFAAELVKLVQRLFEGAVVVGLVAEIDREQEIGALAGALAVEAAFLERGGAEAEPVVLGELVDQRVFGGGGGLMLGAEVGQELVVVVLRFPVEHGEGLAGETVAAGVLAGGGFAFGGARAGGGLRVGLVGGQLRGGEGWHGCPFGFSQRKQP